MSYYVFLDRHCVGLGDDHTFLPWFLLIYRTNNACTILNVLGLRKPKKLEEMTFPVFNMFTSSPQVVLVRNGEHIGKNWHTCVFGQTRLGCCPLCCTTQDKMTNYFPSHIHGKEQWCARCRCICSPLLQRHQFFPICWKLPRTYEWGFFLLHCSWDAESLDGVPPQVLNSSKSLKNLSIRHPELC